MLLASDTSGKRTTSTARDIDVVAESSSCRALATTTRGMPLKFILFIGSARTSPARPRILLEEVEVAFFARRDATRIALTTKKRDAPSSSHYGKSNPEFVQESALIFCIITQSAA